MPKSYSLFSVFHPLLRIAILLAGIVGLAESCRKVDRVAFTSQTLSETEAKFFTNHRSADARQKALVDFLKRKNDTLHFVETTAGRIGYPRWNKAITVFKENTIQRRGGNEDENAAITYIPFVRDSQNFVNASLLIKTTSRDTVFRYLLDWQYASYGFDTVSTGWNARDVFHVFARLNKEVFGKTAFRITDERLFGAAPPDDEVIVKVRTSEAPLRTEGVIRVCVYDDICYNPPDGIPCEECTLDCPQYQYTEESCTIYWLDDDWFPDDGGGAGGGGSGTGGGSSGGGGGGSGGGGNGTPPQCNNGTTPPDPAICGPAWEIYDDDLPAPNEDPIAENLKKAYLKVKYMADSLHNKAQTDGDERAFSYFKNNNDTVAYNSVIGNYQSSDPETGIGIFGLNHTHQDNGLPAANSQSDANQTFDTDDIFKFYSDHVLPVGSKELRIQTVTTRDYVYAAYITDINLFKANMVVQAGSSIFSLMDDNLLKKFDTLMKSCNAPPACTYERRSELALLAMFGNNSGISFYKSPRNNINFVKL